MIILTYITINLIIFIILFSPKRKIKREETNDTITEEWNKFIEEDKSRNYPNKHRDFF